MHSFFYFVTSSKIMELILLSFIKMNTHFLKRFKELKPLQTHGN